MPISKNYKNNNFLHLTLQNLTDTTNLIVNNDISFPIKKKDLDLEFLNDLIISTQDVIDYWTEQELVMKQLSFILANAKLQGEKYSTFAERNISAKINGYTFGGYVDFLVAKGIYEPTRPFFFIQEFKKSRNQGGDPLAQLLGEMLVAQELNQDPEIYGVYIVGKYWTFVPMKGLAYCQKASLDSTDLEDLKTIFYHLNWVKQYVEEKLLN